MIKLFREEISAEADTIEAEFRDMILGYDRIIVDPAEASTRFGPEHSLPVITNNERIVSGEAITPYLNELQDLMREWQAFQGDSCYVNENGKICFK
jgi:hypothetical protein